VSGSAVVSYANYIDSDDTVLTLDGATASADHPISNLKLRGLGDYLQLDTEFDPLVIDADLGEVKEINFVAMMGLGTMDPAFIQMLRFNIYESADGVSYTLVAQISVNDFAPMYLPGILFGFIQAGFSTRYLRVQYNGSALQEPKRLARLWADKALILENVVEDSPDFSFRDAGELSETDGQQYVEFRKLRTKSLSLTLRGLSTLQAWGFSNGASQALNVPSINGMQFAAGLTGEVIVLPIAATADPETDTLWQRRTGVYGHIVSPYQITRDMNAESWRTSFTVQEER
jgi:hypothetical protein